MTTVLIAAAADVQAVLADPAYQVPPAQPVPAGDARNLAWLRASVSRFCEGPAHERRRGLAEHALATMEPGRLRRGAAALTAAELARAGQEPFDAMRLARRIPVAVLAAELGIAGNAAVDAVLAVSTGYQNPEVASADADASVALLVRALGLADAEAAANQIALLVQACDATAGLIGNALVRAFGPEGAGGHLGQKEAVVHLSSPGTGGQADAGAAGELVAATLREDPPVLRTRRLRPDGAVVLVDITTVPFGAGRRPCPGADHAVALAAGVLDAVIATCVPAGPDVIYPRSENLRVPEQLLLVLR